jgi:aspartate kinase
MSWVVKKFGGTSVGSPSQIERVCQYLAGCYRAGERFVVVVSAMAGETNRLITLMKELDDKPYPEFYDRVFATGELASIALVAIGLNRLNIRAVPLSGAEVPLWTVGGHQKARVQKVETALLEAYLKKGVIPLVAGCQGVDKVTRKMTTLGRGGSDTTAVALAVGLGSSICEIFTDVEGIYSTDPRICKQARILKSLDYMTMMELASLGAKVLQIRSVDLAYRYGIPIHVRSAFSWKEGTMITAKPSDPYERLCVSHVTLDDNQAKICIQGLPNQGDRIPMILAPLAREKINIDMIVQSFCKDQMDVYFTVGKAEFDKALRITQTLAGCLGADQVSGDDQVSKVSAVGSGMMDHWGVASKFFEVLSQDSIPVYLISTSEIKISVLVPKQRAARAVELLHRTFIEESWDPDLAFESAAGPPEPFGACQLN